MRENDLEVVLACCVVEMRMKSFLKIICFYLNLWPATAIYMTIEYVNKTFYKIWLILLSML